DIFETDFDVPALEEESGSEAVALDDADTNLDSSDFDLALEEGDVAAQDESGSQVVALGGEEGGEAGATTPAPGRKARKKPKKAAALGARRKRPRQGPVSTWALRKRKRRSRPRRRKSRRGRW